MTANPQMIVLAREAAGLTQGAVAHEVGVSQAHLSKIENGFESPSVDLLERLSATCVVPLSFFQQSDQILGEGMVDFFHRKRATLPAKPLKKAQAQVNVVRLESLRLLRDIELTDVAPLPSLGQHGLGPVEAAQSVRMTWRVPAGPLPNLVALLESAGVVVHLMDLGHDKLSAITMPGAAGRPIVVLNITQSASKQRFTLAHELGHLVLHDGSFTDTLEEDADAFASELLMPRVDIDPQLRGVRFRDLGALKASWRVSMAALIYRAKALGHITDRQYRTFWIQLNQLPGGRGNEPGEFDREQPRLMSSVVQHYLDDLAYSDEQLAALAVVDHDVFLRRYLGKTTTAIRPVGRAPLYSIPTPR